MHKFSLKTSREETILETYINTEFNRNVMGVRKFKFGSTGSVPGLVMDPWEHDTKFRVP
jgi:hypothetical protein